MTHVDEGRLQALLDEELHAGERAEVETHLRDCLACRTELAGLRDAGAAFGEAMLLLERPRPVARDYAIAWPRRGAGGWARVAGALPRAAVLVLGFAAAAAAVVPGSPLRGWVEGLGEPEAAPVAIAPVSAELPEAAPDVEAPPESGVLVDPLNGTVRVDLRDAGTRLGVRASLSDAAQAGVFATGAAADARFDTGPGRIEVVGAGSGELRIELPRGASSATVTVNGVEYLRKEGDQLRLVAPAEDSAGAEVRFRVK